MTMDPWRTACALLRTPLPALTARLAKAECGPWETRAAILDAWSWATLEAAALWHQHQPFEAWPFVTKAAILRLALDHLDAAADAVAKGGAHDDRIAA